MITEYIQAALDRAAYEIIDDPEPCYGEVPEMEGVWATGTTLEECCHNLAEAIDGWLIVRLRKGLSVPQIGELRVEELKSLEVTGCETGKDQP
ncbi:MAG: type II toxin-antitoxin system HicB family antitoxin [Spirochaetales bacterium]|nr:type II toxin-antitoxin system HicB family antitoxin [Spirochaetales bacterium]